MRGGHERCVVTGQRAGEAESLLALVERELLQAPWQTEGATALAALKSG